MKVHYTRSSLAQLNKILAHIEAHSPQGVRGVQARIQEVIALIAFTYGAESAGLTNRSLCAGATYGKCG
jgi:hypothetical protein